LASPICALPRPPPPRTGKLIPYLGWLFFSRPSPVREVFLFPFSCFPRLYPPFSRRSAQPRPSFRFAVGMPPIVSPCPLHPLPILPPRFKGFHVFFLTCYFPIFGIPREWPVVRSPLIQELNDHFAYPNLSNYERFSSLEFSCLLLSSQVSFPSWR